MGAQSSNSVPQVIDASEEVRLEPAYFTCLSASWSISRTKHFWEVLQPNSFLIFVIVNSFKQSSTVVAHIIAVNDC